MGKFNINISGSNTIGAQAVGDQATATGHVNATLFPGILTQERFNQEVSDILNLLADRQDELREIVSGLGAIRASGKSRSEVTHEVQAALAQIPKPVLQRLKAQLEPLAQGLASNAVFLGLQNLFAS